jgi:hypothetical protein
MPLEAPLAIMTIGGMLNRVYDRKSRAAVRWADNRRNVVLLNETLGSRYGACVVAFRIDVDELNFSSPDSAFCVQLVDGQEGSFKSRLPEGSQRSRRFQQASDLDGIFGPGIT